MDRLKEYRLLDDWKLTAEEGTACFKANGLDIDPDLLVQRGPAIFASLEFKGQLDCFG